MYTINPDINHDYSAQERTKIKNQSFTFNRTEKFNMIQIHWVKRNSANNGRI